MLWVEGRVLQELNLKLPAKKNEYTRENNILRIYLENLQNLWMNLSQKIISNQLDIKLGQFLREELDLLLRKRKNSKAAGLDEIPLEEWKTRKFDDILL